MRLEYDTLSDYRPSALKQPGLIAKQMNLLNRDGSVLMEVSEVRREGSRLVVIGSIMGAMPVEATMTPTEVRAGFGLLSLSKILFIISLLFRS